MQSKIEAKKIELKEARELFTQAKKNARKEGGLGRFTCQTWQKNIELLQDELQALRDEEFKAKWGR